MKIPRVFGKVIFQRGIKIPCSILENYFQRKNSRSFGNYFQGWEITWSFRKAISYGNIVSFGEAFLWVSCLDIN